MQAISIPEHFNLHISSRHKAHVIYGTPIPHTTELWEAFDVIHCFPRLVMVLSSVSSSSVSPLDIVIPGTSQSIHLIRSVKDLMVVCHLHLLLRRGFRLRSFCADMSNSQIPSKFHICAGGTDNKDVGILRVLNRQWLLLDYWLSLFPLPPVYLVELLSAFIPLQQQPREQRLGFERRSSPASLLWNIPWLSVCIQWHVQLKSGFNVPPRWFEDVKGLAFDGE